MANANLQPLCDQMHGKMNAATLPHVEGGSFDGFRCTSCGRVFTEFGGYRASVDGRASAPTVGQPRCRQDKYAMYVSEYRTSSILLYKCPDEGCSESVDVPIEIDEASGLWKQKQNSER